MSSSLHHTFTQHDKPEFPSCTISWKCTCASQFPKLFCEIEFISKWCAIGGQECTTWKLLEMNHYSCCVRFDDLTELWTHPLDLTAINDCPETASKTYLEKKKKILQIPYAFLMGKNKLWQLCVQIMQNLCKMDFAKKKQTRCRCLDWCSTAFVWLHH